MLNNFHGHVIKRNQKSGTCLVNHSKRKYFDIRDDEGCSRKNVPPRATINTISKTVLGHRAGDIQVTWWGAQISKFCPLVRTAKTKPKVRDVIKHICQRKNRSYIIHARFRLTIWFAAVMYERRSSPLGFNMVLLLVPEFMCTQLEQTVPNRTNRLSSRPLSINQMQSLRAAGWKH